MAQIIVDGVTLATPSEFALTPEGELWGLFLAGEELQCDEWLYWGRESKQLMDAIARAGVEVTRED